MEEMENSYMMVRLMGGHKVIAVAVNSDVVRGFMHMREAATLLGGGVSRTRRVQVHVFNNKELHGKVTKTRLVEVLPEGKSTEMQAIIYADGTRGTVSFQTLEGKGDKSKRGPNSMMIDESDLSLALAFALRIENMQRRAEAKRAEKEEKAQDKVGETS